jgi:2-methylcitrate dehydratase
MAGFLGPRDIFRNPEAIWRQFEPTGGDCPFDLVLSRAGDDFAVMGMHFKLGLYEHQSAGALQGLITLLEQNPEILTAPDAIESIKVVAYEPAFGIIGDPAKRDPRTRQSADHSMVYIVSTLLRKAIEAANGSSDPLAADNDGYWKRLMLSPYDYAPDAIDHAGTRALMQKITFEHGGPDYDARYPDGIPTSLVITDANGTEHDSGLVMYPSGHARNTAADLEDILAHKFILLGELALANAKPVVESCRGIGRLDASALKNLYTYEILDNGPYE